MTKHAVTLDDKYTQESGVVFMSSVQALVRLPIVQKRRDVAAGLNTAGYITGYRGSPLGVYDMALWAASKHLKSHSIEFIPGVNEELAAASIRGTQQLHWFDKPKFDGVFSLWYGKGLGVDRAHEALKMGNFEGAAKHGGVLVIGGDDHGGKSSATAHQSEQVLAAAMIPVLYPANTQEILEYGLYGIAMSRFSGLWVSMKGTNDTLEATASVNTDVENIDIIEPTDFAKPANSLNILKEEIFPIPQEQKVIRFRLPAAQAFARANKLDRVIYDSNLRTLGIVTAGKSYLDVRQALVDLGITEARAKALGIRIYKLGMTWPVEPQTLAEFVNGHKEILVVEEKRPFIEDQVRALLYNQTDPAMRPPITGKLDLHGNMLIPADGETSPAMLCDVIGKRLESLNLLEGEIGALVTARRNELVATASVPSANIIRTAYFCSGCPHNSSTVVPEGHLAFAGVGCHALAHFMPGRPTAWAAQMGAEGSLWIGLHRFTGITHAFQNLGDGTYFHSGSLGIRASVGAGSNITYKLLYNDAIAMTGGQPIDGKLTVDMMARQVAAEGVQKVVIVTDEPDKYPADTNWPAGLTIHHRSELVTVEEQLSNMPGVTAMIYDQTCAAEKRRRRKRGLMVDPDKRTFINSEVCEGCGDCSSKSNCVSVQPLETSLGRKRQIDQSNCNKDFSCVTGFCPSFVTLYGAKVRKAEKSALKVDPESIFATLPTPSMPALIDNYGVLVTGIGGTGVLTVGAILGMAAHLEGKGCSIMDMTGMAQKNGAVLSHLRLAPTRDEIYSTRIGAASAAVVIGCDMVVSAGMEAMKAVRPGVTRSVINSTIVPTAQFQANKNVDFQEASLLSNIKKVNGADRVSTVDATRLATALLGDSIATNLFMVGYAVQKGLVPLSLETITEAIRLNGVAVTMNMHAFNWGRVAAHDPALVEQVADQMKARPAADTEHKVETLNDVIAIRKQLLTDYQSSAYASKYLDLVEWACKREQALMADAMPGSERLTAAVAHNYAKVMAYKDEYEVARLYTSGSFKQKLNETFEGDFEIKFNLAPPLFSKRDPRTGELIKKEYPAWTMSAFNLLARFKSLRGTALDIFGKTEERAMERRLIGEYEALVRHVFDKFSADKMDQAVEILSLYDDIRGYGHIKEQNHKQVKQKQAALLAKYEGKLAATVVQFAPEKARKAS